MTKTAWTDGVKKLAPGKYLVRVTWTDKIGKRHDTERKVLADTKAKAQQARAELQRELAGPRDRGWLLSHALDQYIATTRDGTKHCWDSYARRINRAFGGRRLGDITTAEIQRFLYNLPLADNTANGYRTLFIGTYKHARICGEYAGVNVAKETEARRPKKTEAERLAALENPVKRAYLGDETQRFLAALDPNLRALQIIQIFLGCRFGEASALEWRDVDLETGDVNIRRKQYVNAVSVPKNGKERPTALGAQGIMVLKAHKARMEELKWPGWDRLVFPRPVSYHARASDMWSSRTAILKVTQAQKAAGITVKSKTHAARHTHITLAEVDRVLHVEASVDLGVIHRQMVGHASEAQSRAYVDKSALPRRRLAASIEKAIVGEILGTEP
jgi:integrase